MNGCTFKNGLKDGIPIALGYLSVSFGFGVAVVNSGLSVLAGVVMSLSNLTSAGQVAGLTLIATGATLLETALTQLVINLRYSLMSLSLSQKADASFTTLHRFILSFAITDEIFAVASSKKGVIGRGYMYGLALFPILGWTFGTFLGAVAGEVLPASIKTALGIAIYAMLVAVVVPPAKKERGILLCVALAAALSCVIYYLPALGFVTPGFSIIICGVLAAVAAAVIMPVKDGDGE